MANTLRPELITLAEEVRTAELLRAFLESRSDEMLKLLERLVRIESPSSDPAALETVLAVLEEALEGVAMVVRRIPGGAGGGHLLARPKGRSRSRPSQILIGHCDTVWPRGTLDTMPWRLEGEKVRGPGVYDMKAGLVQGIFAIEALRSMDLRAEVTPWFFINSDEEVGSPSSKKHLQRLARCMERVFVLEPSLGRRGKLKTSRKGVGRFLVRARGRAAHAGLDPEGGASAILGLSYVIQELFALNDPARGITVNVGQIEGGLGPNVIAPESRAVVDVRTVSSEDEARIGEAVLGLSSRTPGVSIHVEGGIGRPPMEETPRNRLLFRRARELGRALGLEIEGGQAGGSSDGNFTSCFTATLDGLGAVGGGAHADHEFVDRAHMIDRTALLALLLLEPSLAKVPGDG